MLRNICDSYITFSEIHGYGAFTSKDVAAGDEIEQFLLLPLPWRTHDLDRRTNVFRQYAMTILRGRDDWTQKYGSTFAFPGGNLMFYNHNTVPNVKISSPTEVPSPNGEIAFNTVIALRDLEADSELFLDYATCYASDWETYFQSEDDADPEQNNSSE